MKRFIPVVTIAMLLGAWASADTYKLDPVHSTVVFRIGHLVVSNVNGRFNGPTGTVEFDPAAPEKTKFDVQVEVKKIDTNNQQRDTHLKSKDFFDAERFPVISFKSTSVKKVAEGELEVAGDMSLHGVTKQITVKLSYKGPVTDPQMGTRSGFGTAFEVKRSDYGMNNMIPAVGDTVKLTVDLEGAKQ